MSADLALLNNSFDGFSDGFVTKLLSENDLPQYVGDRLRRLFAYTCKGGKYFRAMQVLSSARLSCAQNGVDFASVEKKAVALAWAVEVLQACFLVADDIMDGSTTRRGQPCWYLQPDVQNDAINDSLVLESFMHYLIQEGSDEKTLVTLYKLYQDVSLKTQMGQTLDLLSMPQGRKSVDILRSFDLTLYKRIVKFKTAFYTFYLPMAAGLILGGTRDAATLKAVEAVCMEIGEKFQIQDDYLDNYGDPAFIGKVGTDIQDHKCSWLCVQALERMNDEQRARFEANYGHHEPEKVAAIKALFDELDMPALYAAQEEASLARVNAIMEDNKDLIKKEWFEGIIALVHNRKK